MKSVLIKAGVTCFGLGLPKKGAGTLASLVACFFWWGLGQVASLPVIAAVLIAILLIGILLIQAYSKMGSEDDASEIVIDEWVGMGIAMLGVLQNIPMIFVAFGFFRLFDIWKPPGVRYFDRNHLHGWGVMMDDVVAGIYAAIVVALIHYFI